MPKTDDMCNKMERAPFCIGGSLCVNLMQWRGAVCEEEGVILCIGGGLCVNIAAHVHQGIIKCMHVQPISGFPFPCPRAWVRG